MGSAPTMTPMAPMGNNNSSSSNNAKASMSSPVTYIPPLCDGACGTIPRAQQPMMAMMRQEMMEMMRMMPTLCWAMLTQNNHVSMGDMADMMMHTLLACMEMCMMMAAIPMCLLLPGMVSAMWMCCCAAMVMAMCWMINGSEQMHHCNAGSEGWMMGQEGEDEKWMFVGGMGMSSRHCHRITLPMMSRLFGKPMTCICMPTYGLPFDMMMMMLQRCMPIQTQARRNLYAQIRCALLDDSMHRCVVICHNQSSIMVSHAVAQLCCDLPMEKLRKLEIYTFGAAACEFLMPLGEANLEPEPIHQQHPADMMSVERKGIHVEHFAMADDPFAQMGVLRGVRRDMNNRMCGGVFIMNNMSSMNSNSNSNNNNNARPMAPCTGMMMEDYLAALFPAQANARMPSPPMPVSTMPARSVLDCKMYIDRDCAEKREIAAMTNYHSASGSRKDGNKRLSWTGLAAASTNGMAQKNGVSAGMAGLEMARKGCKDCSGHKGRDVSWLVRYVASANMNMGDAKQTSGPDMMGMGMRSGTAQ